MIKSRPRPTGCVVALSTIGGKRRSYVIWICGTVVIGLVAAVTRRRQRRVVVVRVARRARHCYVRTGQRERRFAVIEGRCGPSRRGVASCAGCWEPQAAWAGALVPL